MSNTKIKRQHYKVGAIVKISLDADSHSYARLLDAPLIACYDVKTDKDLQLELIVSKPILFKIWVMRYAITSGRWIKVGYLPLEEYLCEQPTFFKQDPMLPDKFYLYRDQDAQEYPVSREQCIGLERAAAWNPEHVEDRLRDYYLGKPNKWVELLSLPASEALSSADSDDHKSK